MDTDPSITIWAQLLLLLVLTFINAFFAASEMAIVSVNRNRLEILKNAGNKKAFMVETLMEEPTKFLSTIQVAITLSSFFSSASAATGISQSVGVTLVQWGVPFAQQVAFFLVTFLLAFFTLIFGELVPKRIALQKSEKIAMIAVKPVMLIGKIASPFIRILSWCTKGVLRIVGMDAENIEEMVSEEEIRSQLANGQKQGVFNENEKAMIDSIFNFDDILAEEIMTPRTDVFCIDIEAPSDTYLDEIMGMQYTRIPVYQNEIDDIIGILNVKDFVREARKSGFEHVDIRHILRKAYFVPETKNIDELFRELQHARQHIAVLIDEYGGFSGIVTMEDLIEEIMGDIEDEFDEEEGSLARIDEHTYEMDGAYSIHDLNDQLQLELPSELYDTIGGFLIDELGRIPQGDKTITVSYENLTFTILSLQDKRIQRVQLRLASNDLTSKNSLQEEHETVHERS